MRIFKSLTSKFRRLNDKGLSFEILLATPKFSLHFCTFERNGELVPLVQPRSILLENNNIKENKHPLLQKMERFIVVNLDNEQFGVEQLAEQVGMSRSHLHRKLKKVSGKSISQFIREYRLQEARNMLIEKEMTASEVSHAVGFGSPSYFSKCFTEYFGYSPGKARLKVGRGETHLSRKNFTGRSKLPWLAGLAALVMAGFLYFYFNKRQEVVAESVPKEKSIIVLPFKNLSSDEEN